MVSSIVVTGGEQTVEEWTRDLLILIAYIVALCSLIPYLRSLLPDKGRDCTKNFVVPGIRETKNSHSSVLSYRIFVRGAKTGEASVQPEHRGVNW